MAKIVHCSDVGFDCDGVVHAATEEEALRKVAEHARTVHGMETMSPRVVAKVRSAMRDEPPHGPEPA